MQFFDTLCYARIIILKSMKEYSLKILSIDCMVVTYLHIGTQIDVKMQ